MSIPRFVVVLSVAVPLALIATQMAGAAPQRPDAERERASVLAIEAGRDTFEQFCAPCHGSSGKGGGVIAPRLSVVPDDLTAARRRNQGVFPLARFETLLTASTQPQGPGPHSSSQMPLWGATFRGIDHSPALARARVVNVLAYLESIQE